MNDSIFRLLSAIAFESTRVSTTSTRTPARLALAIADAISRDPLGVTINTLIEVWSRFSMICICFSTSISRSAAWTTNSRPALLAASCAPRCMSRKNGWFSVFITKATRGAPVVLVALLRLQPEKANAAASNPTTARPHRLLIRLSLSPPLERHIDQNGANDNGADDDLLEKRRHVQQVQTVSQHAHDQCADQRADQRAFPAEQARPTDDRRRNRVELVHRPRGWLRRVEPRGQHYRGDRAR